MVIKTFKGAYERDVVIELEEEVCSMCGEKKMVLVMDGSEGEYTVARICEDCINKAFSKIERKVF